MPFFLNKLDGLIDCSFSLRDIRPRCFNLGVDYESMAGEEMSAGLLLGALLVLAAVFVGALSAGADKPVKVEAPATEQ